MTKFILHGGFTQKENPLNLSFFTEFLKDVPDNGEVLLVYFASRTDEEVPEKFERHVKVCREQSKGKDLNFRIATIDNFLEEIEQSDAIFFNGGSTSKLLKVLKSYPDLRTLVQGKTVAGSSAGAYVLATLGTSHSEEVVREGLGFVPLRVVCHYESPDLPPSDDSVESLKVTATDLELVLLKDFEWKAYFY